MLLQFLLWSNASYWVLTQASSSGYIKSNYATTHAEFANTQLKERSKRNIINTYKIKTFIFDKISKMAKFIDKTSSNLFPTSSSENQGRLPFDENKLVYIGKPKSNIVQHSDYPKASHSVHHTEQHRLPKHSVSHSTYTSKVPSPHHGSAGVISSYVSTSRHASNQQHTSTPVNQSPSDSHALNPKIHSSTTLQVSSTYAKTNMQKPIEAGGGYIAAPATPEKPRLVFPFILRNISKEELQLGKVHFPKALSTLWNNSEADASEYIDEDMDQIVEDIYENNMFKLSKIHVSSDENEAESSVPSNISSRDELLVNSSNEYFDSDSSLRSSIKTEDASLPSEQQLSTTNIPKKVIKLGKKNLQTARPPVTRTTVPTNDQSINSELSPSQVELEDTTRRVVKTFGYLKPKVKKVVKMLDDNSYASDISLKPNYQTESKQEIKSHPTSVSEDRVYFSKTAILGPEFHPVSLPSKIKDKSTKGRIYFDKNSILPPEFHAFSLPINKDDHDDENASHVKKPDNHHESLSSLTKVEEKEKNDVDLKDINYDEDDEGDSKEYDDNNEEYDDDKDNEEVEYEGESVASAGVLVYLVTDKNNPDEPYLVPASVLDDYIQ